MACHRNRIVARRTARPGWASPAAQAAAAPRPARRHRKPQGHWRKSHSAGCRPSRDCHSSTAVPGTVIPGLRRSGSSSCSGCRRSSHPDWTAARRTVTMPAAAAARASSSPTSRRTRPARTKPAGTGTAELVGRRAGSSRVSNREHSLRPGGRTTWILMPPDRQGSTRAGCRRRGSGAAGEIGSLQE